MEETIAPKTGETETGNLHRPEERPQDKTTVSTGEGGKELSGNRSCSEKLLATRCGWAWG